MKPKQPHEKDPEARNTAIALFRYMVLRMA